MAEPPTGVRVTVQSPGSAASATGLPVLDHLIGELARAARLGVSLEVAPGSVEAEVAAAGRALGGALRELLTRPATAGRGWALTPSGEALAAAALELSEEPGLVVNVDFSDQEISGVRTDVVSSFLAELSEGAGVNLHVRVLEGTDPQHVVEAMFKSVGAALGIACRPHPET